MKGELQAALGGTRHSWARGIEEGRAERGSLIKVSSICLKPTHDGANPISENEERQQESSIFPVNRPCKRDRMRAG